MSVAEVEWGIECWEAGPLGDDKEPSSFGALATVRTLAYFGLDEKQLVGFENSGITFFVF